MPNTKGDDVRRKITPETKALAQKAAEWVNSPEGQAAIEKSVAIAKEAVQPLKDSQREENERLTGKIRRLGIEPENKILRLFS